MNHVFSQTASLPQRSGKRKYIFWLILLLVALAAAFFAFRGGEPASAQAPPIASTVAQMPEQEHGVGFYCQDICLPVRDRWGARLVVFHYTQLDCGPEILLRIDELDASGRLNQIELSSVWFRRFRQALAESSDNSCGRRPRQYPPADIEV